MMNVTTSFQRQHLQVVNCKIDLRDRRHFVLGHLIGT